MNKNIETIIRDGMAEGKTFAEINKDLEAAGSSVRLNANRTGNALLDTGTGSLDPVTVVDGKLTNGDGGIPRQDEVIFAGKTWWLDDDRVTLIPKEVKEPWWAQYHTYGGLVPWQYELDKYIPDKDMMDRPAYAGKTVIKGALRYRYDETGKAHYEPKSMAEYGKDHAECERGE